MITTSKSPKDLQSNLTLDRKIPTFIRILSKAAPFFLSAAFLLSGFFAVFAPLPILFSLYRIGWWAGILGILTNGAIVRLAGGVELAQLYVWIVTPLFFGFWICALRPNLRLEAKVYLAWFLQMLFFIAAIAIYAKTTGVSPLTEAQNALTQFLDIVSQKPGASEQILSGMEPDEWKKATLRTLPVTFSLSVLVLTFANFYLMIGLNPRGKFSRLGLTRKAVLDWKMPEWLIWPMILLWVGALFGEKIAEGLFSEVCLGGLKLAAAGYGIQGVAILSAQLDRWKTFGFFRSFIFIMVLLFMMPLVLSVGFFDQWFDLRAKFRQSNTE